MFQKIQIILMFTFLATSQLWAQTSTEQPVKTDVEKEEAAKTSATTESSENVVETTVPASRGSSRVEKVEVTGSYIRRADIEGPSPILVIDRAQIEKSGFNSVGEILRRSTVSPFGGSGSEVSLKGLGSGRTLVLINGQRAPGSGSSYASGAVSVNFVPIAAVERIEVLKDGASATYGSDALGGVVNIITRKDLDGFSFANKYDMSTNIGSDTNLTSLAYGTQGAKSNLMTSVQVQYIQGSRASDFDFAKKLNQSIPFSTNYQGDSGAFLPGPYCTEFNQSGACQEAVSPMQVTLPSLGVDWVTDYSYQISGNTTAYTTLITGYSRGQDTFPNVLNTPGQSLGMGFSAAETPASWNSLPGYTGGDTFVFHRFDDYINKSTSQNYYGALILGLKGYVGNSDWQWDVSANNQVNINEVQEENLATVSGSRALITADAYNPFDTSKRDLTGLGIDAMNRNRAVVNWVEAKTNGELGNFLGFDWASAFGVSAAHFEYADHRADAIVQGDVMLQSGVVGSGGRELYSVFTELSGLVSNEFELQLSLRGDAYSDFGSTINPKVAARYQPTGWLTFRSSVGTGFQAPTLQNMNAKIEGYDFLVDQVRCKDPTLGASDPNSDFCQTQSISVFQNNNENLKEERSISFNFGTIVEPVKNFTISLDWWYVKVQDTIGASLDDILRLEEQDASKPADYGVNIIRENNVANGRIERIEYVLFNVGEEQADGLDLELAYKMPTQVGDFTFTNETTYMGHFHQSFYKEFGKEQVLGRFGLPRWRNNFNLGYNRGPFGVTAVARSFADVEKNVRGLGKVVSATQYDLTFLYNTEQYGSFQLGALNLFNVRPRFDDTFSSRVNGSLFRRTETYFLTWRTDF